MKLTDTFNLGEKGYLLRNGYVISILDVPYSTEYHWRTSIITAIKNSLTLPFEKYIFNAFQINR